MAASDPSLTAFLQAGLATLPPGGLLVGYSGGIDSHVLLHALAQLPEARARGLRALHVDHGLAEASADWARHAGAVCAGLEVPLRVVAVRVEVADDGLEAAARRARWAAFQAEARTGEILVLAHHRDDQAETVLLRLLRGAGPAGLAAMRAWSLRASGLRVWRPWLGGGGGMPGGEFRSDAVDADADADAFEVAAGTGSGSGSGRTDADSRSAAASNREAAGGRSGARHPGDRRAIGREQIRAHALAAGLDPVADPANADPRHDRSYLRHTVMPTITARWPGAAAALAQVAQRQADALALEQDAGRTLLALASTDDTAALRWPPLQRAAQARRWAALRLWLASHGVADAGAGLLARIDVEVIGAAVDAGPRLDLGACVLRRYRDQLYALAPGADAPLDYQLPWDGCAPLPLPGGAGELRLDPVPAQPLPLVVCSRRGGERMQLRTDGPHRDLRLLLQEAGVPPWQRARWPVLWLDGQPAGFADLAMAPPLAARLQQLDAQLRFRPD